MQTGLRRGIYFVGAIASTERADSFPGGVSGVIGVDASGDQGNGDAVLYAPGHDILTLVPGGSYDFLSGSSLAAASISGGIALLLARDRTLRPEQARSILARSTRWIDTGQGPIASVDLCAALAMVVADHRCSQRATDSGQRSTLPAVAGKAEKDTQASLIPCADSGSERTGLPFIIASALASAGAMTGVPGSPTPVGLFVDGRMCTSMAGISLMRSTG